MIKYVTSVVFVIQGENLENNSPNLDPSLSKFIYLLERNSFIISVLNPDYDLEKNILRDSRKKMDKC